MGNLLHKKIPSIFILIMLVSTYLFGMGFETRAAEKQITVSKISNTRYEYTYRVQSNIELRGVNGESRWYFNVDKSFAVKDLTFNLYYNISSVIRPDVSYLTVYLNDVPVESIKLRDNDQQLSKFVKCKIPVDKIIPGYNNLKVITYSRISDIPCADDLNIANWIVIDGRTNYVIGYDKSETQYTIADFPSPFIGRFADNAAGIGVVIPKGYTNLEIASALTLIAHLQAYQADNDVAISLIKADDPNIGEYDSLIYIGKYEGLPDSFKPLDLKGKSINPQNASLFIRKTGGKPAFMILSDDGQSLLNAVRAIKNEDVKMQMDESFFEITKDFDTSIKVDRTDDYVSLSELGINGIELVGAKKQVTNLSVSVPFNEVISSDANIHLKYRYSDNLDYEKSYVSVYINGTPIGSQILEKSKKENDELTLLIPENLKKSSYYNIQIIFQMIPSGELTCERSLYANPWAYIEAESNLYLPTSDRPLLQFENLPNPFCRNNDIDDTTIVMPDKPDGEDLNIACALAQMIGIGVTDNRGTIYATRGDLFSSDDYTDNLILFGTPDENAAIRTVNGSLWFPYDIAYSQLLSNEKLELLPPTSKTATVFEIKRSPMNQEKGLMTVTSKSRDRLIKSMEYFGAEKRGMLTGDAAVITKNGDISTYRFQKEERRPLLTTAIFQSKNIKDYLLFAGGVMAIILLGIIMYHYKNKRR